MTVVEKPALSRASVVEAAARIARHLRRTPTERSPALSQLAGRDVYLKLENLQRTGAFKIRGALNALTRLDATKRAAGVVTASAGNHGQGVAFAAQLVGAPATVVLPQGVPLAKLTAIQRSGAETVLADGGYDEAHAVALEIARAGAPTSPRATMATSSPARERSHSSSSRMRTRSTPSSCRSAAADSSRVSRSPPRSASRASGSSAFSPRPPQRSRSRSAPAT